MAKKARALLKFDNCPSLPSLLRSDYPTALVPRSTVDWSDLVSFMTNNPNGVVSQKQAKIWNSHIKWKLWSSVFQTLQGSNLALASTFDNLHRPSFHVIDNVSKTHIRRNQLSRVLSSTAKECWYQQWRSLPKCGDSLRCVDNEIGDKPKGDFHPASFEFLRRPWLLSDRNYSFALQARTECLPCGTNLHQWYKSPPYCRRSSCRRIKDTGNHRLNACKSRLPLYRDRHDAILSTISSYCDTNIQDSCDAVDYNLLWDQTTPPEYYGSGSSLRPDIQLIVGPRISATLLDLKVPL